MPAWKSPIAASWKRFSPISARSAASTASNASTKSTEDATCPFARLYTSAQPRHRSLAARYNETMKYRVLLLGVCVLTAGCGHHPLTDYRPLDRAGMWSSGLEQLKALDTSDSEVAQLVRVKQANLSDDACVALVKAAHEHKHPFVTGESSANLIAAGYSESQVLEIAKADKLDSLSGDLVALRLIGLSDSTLEFVLRRRLEGRPTMSS